MWRILLVAALALVLPQMARAQDCRLLTPQAASAARTSGPMVLDGALDEPAWAAAAPLTEFHEYFPGNCTPPPEKSEVRFVYDDQYLYVGFRASLRDVSKLRKPFVRRDKVNAALDYMQVYLDPLGSRRSAYLFRVSARGVRTDGLQDEGKQTESTAPDFDWDVRTRIGPDGWTAELRIPLSTLRLSRAGPQQWAVIVTRGVPRGQNTQMATAPFPHNSSCFLCFASTLTFPDISPRTERVIVTPSVVIGGRRDRGSYGSGDHADLQPSLDLKWLPYAGAALDLTINPDFSQVEADSPQLTGNQRFAINLPEKRPFFREGSDLIGTPLPVLYTRTISAPDYGLRFTHRSARFNATAFAAEDGGHSAIVEPGLLASQIALPDFDSKVAFAHAVDGLGAVQVGGLGAVKVNDDGSYNVVGGVDANWGGSSDRLTGQLLYSATRNPDRPDLLPDWLGQRRSGVAAFAEWDHTQSTLISSLRYTRYDPGFRSWLGYVPRVGYQEAYALVQRPWNGSGTLNTIAPYVSLDFLDAIGRHGHERDPAVGVQLSGARNLNVDVSYRPDTVVLTEQGDERHTRSLQWTAFLNPLPRIPLLQLNGLIGQQVDFETGEVVPARTIAAIVRARPIDRLELELRYTLSTLGGRRGGGERLRESIGEVLATWYFGPAFYVLADAQFYRTDRRYPTASLDKSSLISVQASWDLSPFQTFFGVRSGAAQPQDPSARGRSTEVYLKLSRRFAF